MGALLNNGKITFVAVMGFLAIYLPAVDWAAFVTAPFPVKLKILAVPLLTIIAGVGQGAAKNGTGQ